MSAQVGPGRAEVMSGRELPPGATVQPSRPRRRLGQAAFVVGVALTAGVDVAAQGPHGSQPPPAASPAPTLSQEEKWRRRFPQPVLVSDLIGRKVLNRQQGVLGRIETLVRTPDGEVQIVFSKVRLFVLRGETVAIPAKAAALLGQFLMVMDVSEDEIVRLPSFKPAGTVPIDRASRIQMALTKH